MDQDQKAILIAESQGWTNVGMAHSFVTEFMGDVPMVVCGNPPGKKWRPAPRYFSDLNAMHEAEKVLTDDQQWDWQNHIVSVLPQRPHFKSLMFYIATATAAQRAEAYGLSLNLWKP